MPFAVADIAPLLYAVFTLALACAIGLMVKVIAQCIPNLPIIGSALRDAVNSAGNTAYQFLIGQAHVGWNIAHDLLTDVVWADKWITNYTVQCIDHLGTQASHIWSSLNASVQNIEQTFANLTSEVIPSDIRNAVVTVDALIASTATSLQHNIDRVIDTTIPDAIGDLHTTVDDLISSTATSLQNNINSLSQDVTVSLAEVWAELDPLNTAVNQTLPAEITADAAAQAAATAAAAAAAKAALTAAVNSLQDNLNNVQSGLASSIQQTGAAAAALAGADLNASEGVAAADAAAAVIAAGKAAQTALNATAGAIAASISSINGKIQTLDAVQTITLPALPDITTPGTITVPLAVGALAAEVVAITTEIGECMITSCDGPNSLANNLSKLSGLFSTVGELSFLGAAVKDPKGTADALSDVLGGFWDAGESLFDTLLSI